MPGPTGGNGIGKDPFAVEQLNLSAFEKALIIWLCQYATENNFGVTHRDIGQKFNVARATTDRAFKKLRRYLRESTGYTHPKRYYINYDKVREDAHYLGLAANTLRRRQPKDIGKLGHIDPDGLPFYPTRFGKVPIEQPVEIESQTVEELIASLRTATISAVRIIETLPGRLAEAYEAVSENQFGKHAVMQNAWTALENARAVAATYLQVCERYMFDPRLNTDEYWSVFLYRLEGRHEPVIEYEEETVFGKDSS